MTDENSWIDDVIKQHKKQLNDLKKIRESPLDNSQTPQTINAQSTSNILNNSITNQFQTNFQTVYQNDVDTTKSTPPTLFNYKNDFTPTPALKPQYNEDKLLQKLEKKKQKIKMLRQEIDKLKEENEILKLAQGQTQPQTIATIDTNNFNYQPLIDELNTKINFLETENTKKDKKIFQLENLKNQEIELMNQKIKDFEVIIDENSNGYLAEVNNLKSQIDDYQKKLLGYDKYVEIVNFFIQKVDRIMDVESKEIYDINELQNKFIQIENLLVKDAVQFKNSNLMNTPNQDFFSGSNGDINNANFNNNFQSQNEFGNDQNNFNMPHFQNKFLEENTNMNNASNYQNDEEFNFPVENYKTLEERVMKLEKELKIKPKKVKKHSNHNFSNMSGYDDTSLTRNNSPHKMPSFREDGSSYLQEALTNQNKVVRSKSTNKIKKGSKNKMMANIGFDNSDRTKKPKKKVGKKPNTNNINTTPNVVTKKKQAPKTAKKRK